MKNRWSLRIVAIVALVGAVSACYVKGRADGKMDAELRAIDGLMIAKYALEKVVGMKEKKKHEWLGGVLEGSARMVGGEPPPSIGEVTENLEASREETVRNRNDRK